MSSSTDGSISKVRIPWEGAKDALWHFEKGRAFVDGSRPTMAAVRPGGGANAAQTIPITLKPKSKTQPTLGGQIPKRRKISIGYDTPLSNKSF